MMMFLNYLVMLWFLHYIFELKILLSNLIFFISVLIMMKFVSYVDWVYVSGLFAFNFYSLLLVTMTLWIMGLVTIIMEIDFCFYLNLFMLYVLFLTFSSMSALMFYFFFETSLMIMFVLIVKWGLGCMRLLAGYYFLFYTVFFSFPMLGILFIMINLMGTDLMNVMELMNFVLNNYTFMYFICSFLMKTPIYFFHGWLVKAHVEAPVFGSMILAAILLKLGTYGLLRFVLILYDNLHHFNLDIMIFSLIGGVIISLVCLRQIDLKILVAYSSVVHMSLLLSSMMTLFKLSFNASYMMMIAHGLCSSGLFFLVNLYYEESGSRLMLINKGMMSYMSSLTLMWFLLCSSNMSAPVSLNLISEILMLMTLIVWFKYLLMILMIFCLLSFSYSLYLYSYIQYGEINFYIKTKSVKMINYLILILHWFPLNILFMNLNLFI